MFKMKQDIEKRAKELMNTPTPYVFNFLDVPLDNYVSVLKEVFNYPDFKELMMKRNRIVSSVQYMRSDSAEILNAIRVVRQYDTKLAYTLYNAMVQANRQSSVTYETFSYNTLLKYHVDYSRVDSIDKVIKLTHNLNKITFISDMLEQILVDVKGEMKDLFKGEIEFLQFDAVVQVLKQLKSFFDVVRPKEADSTFGKLYLEYSESINEYMEKRMKTFSEKYYKFNPIQKGWTEDDIIKALNQYFGTGVKFNSDYIAHSKSGGVYIDAIKLLQNINSFEIEKLKRVVGSVDNFKSDTYSYKVTDVIMNAYKPNQ